MIGSFGQFWVVVCNIDVKVNKKLCCQNFHHLKRKFELDYGMPNVPNHNLKLSKIFVFPKKEENQY
jgi:hypothetical protein